MFKFVKFAQLPVHDQDRALAFYVQTLGLTVVSDQPYMPGARWIELAVPGAETRILFSARPDETPGMSPALNLVVDNVQATFTALKAKGVVFSQEPAKAPWAQNATYALFTDSENNIVMIGDD